MDEIIKFLHLLPQPQTKDETTINEWETEPDFEKFTIRGMSYMHKPHRKKRFRKKYAKQNVTHRQMITLHCEIRRVPDMLHLCGYVCVPQQHPFWGWRYYHIDANVHGGLTYGRKWRKSFKFGFDCAHFMDRVPGREILMRKILPPFINYPTDDIYRNMAYVTREVISLANQLLITQEEKVNGYNRAPQRETLKGFISPVFNRKQGAYGKQKRSNLGARGN